MSASGRHDPTQRSVRLRSGVDLKSMPVEAVLERIQGEIVARKDVASE